MAFTPEQHRAYRRRLNAKGTCTTCRKKKAVKGRTKCRGCLTHIMNHTRKIVKERIESGVCYKCGKPTDLLGGKCVNCSDRDKKAEFIRLLRFGGV